MEGLPPALGGRAWPTPLSRGQPWNGADGLGGLGGGAADEDRVGDEDNPRSLRGREQADVDAISDIAVAVAEKMLKPERLLGLLLEKARSEWEKEIRAMRADTEALRAALRASEQRHAQHEADIFRQAQELTNVSFAPEVARHDLTREADDRLARVEINQKELTRRLSAAEVAIERALVMQDRNSATRTVSDQAREAAEDSLSRQIRALEKTQNGRLDDAFDSMSIIMDMCEGFATKDDVQSSVSMLVAGTSGARLAGLENVCDEISRRLHTLEKAQQVEGSRLAEGVPPAHPTGAVLALQSQINSLSRQFAAVMDTVLHGENGPAAQSRRMAAIEARVRREQKKLKEDMERLADTTTEHLRLARRRPSSSTSEEGWQGEASNTRKHKKSLQQLDTEEIETAARVAAEAAITLISERVENLETALRDFSPLELVGQLETSREQIDHLTSEMQVLQRLQKGDSSMVRALRLLQKLMSQPDPTAIFAEFDTDGDKQIDRDELRAGFLKLGEKLSEEDIDAIMELADDDGDDTIDITEFERMGEMTREAVSSVEVKFADLLSKVEREYATQQQLTALAEAVKNSLKAALSAQAKRIADTEEKRSELEEQQLQESLRLISSRVETSEKEIRRQLEQVISDATARLTSENDSLRTRVQHLESRSMDIADNGDRRGGHSPGSSDLVVPSLVKTPTGIGTGADKQGLDRMDGGKDEVDNGDEDELELDTFISGIGLNK